MLPIRIEGTAGLTVIVSAIAKSLSPGIVADACITCTAIRAPDLKRIDKIIHREELFPVNIPGATH